MNNKSYQEILADSITYKASDIHITVNVPIMYRIDGELKPYNPDYVLDHNDAQRLIMDITPKERVETLEEKGEADFSLGIHDIGRFRVNVFKQRGSYAAVLRVIKSKVPTVTELNMPEAVVKLHELKRGLVLVTGPTGSGKSTTLAAILNQINVARKEHIVTLEDPIEFMHHNQKSVVNQREIGADSQSYGNALRASLRQDPDVILIGEMRDLESIGIALTAAETGHLVFSTLHTLGAAKTIDRVVDIFPPHQQSQVRVQLASILQAVVSQQLIPHASGKGRVAAHEIMICTPAIRNLIREGKYQQIATQMQTGRALGMQTLDGALVELVKSGAITRESAMNFSNDPEAIERDLRLVR